LRKAKRTDYLFLSTYLRAKEKELLSAEKLAALLDAPSFDEAARLLVDCGYPDMTGYNAKQVEKCLDERRNALFDEVEKLSPEKNLTEFFRLKYDYHNVKVLVKAEGAGTDGQALLSPAGRVRPQAMADAFFNDSYRFLPEPLGRVLREAKGVLARTGNPQLADFAVDRAYFAELLQTAGGLGSAFLSNYAKTLIDSANLRSAVRCVRMGKDQEFLKLGLVSGGNIGTDRLLANLSGDGLTALFGSTVFEEAAALGAEAMQGGAMTRFERACDNAVMGFLHKARMVSFGSEPVVGYLAALESDITAVRILLTGRLAGIGAERLKERLRDTYA